MTTAIVSSVGLSSVARAVIVAAAFGSLAACTTVSRLSEMGDGPELGSIQNPTQRNDYRQVSMPMPPPLAPPQNANSLWRTGARAFFKDQRAKDVGDILTVNLSINDTATFTTALGRARAGSETATAPALLGFENSLTKFLPQSVNPASLLNAGGTSNVTNSGSTGRTESMTSNVAAVITQVLPNGNLVISGRQELRVNYELKELTVNGIVRPEDISTSNTVTYDKIAEARIYYGGRGNISAVTQPRWGQEMIDVLFPF
jgi:flagellar L-ring protein FlgH